MADIHGGEGKHEGNNYHFWPTDISSAKEVNHTVAKLFSALVVLMVWSITLASISRACWSMKKPRRAI
jgi:hypothetical protein